MKLERVGRVLTVTLDDADWKDFVFGGISMEENKPLELRDPARGGTEMFQRLVQNYLARQRDLRRAQWAQDNFDPT